MKKMFKKAVCLLIIGIMTAQGPITSVKAEVVDGETSLGGFSELLDKYYENLKEKIGDEAKKSKARYALCELVNLHDKSLEFEAIHRVVFNMDADKFIEKMSKEYNLSFDEDANGQSFYLVFGNEKKKVTVLNPKEYLTVATVQKALDEFTKDTQGEIDYIHDAEAVDALVKAPGSIGFLLPAMPKHSLFPFVQTGRTLPRKTFSMGHGSEKRYYLEGRTIK